MTNDAMAQYTIDHWRTEYPEDFKRMEWKEAVRQAKACARLTRKEMDMAKLINPGLTDDEAWSGACSLFCLTPPPVPEEMDPVDQEMLDILNEDVRKPGEIRLSTPESRRRYSEKVDPILFPERYQETEDDEDY